MNSFQLHFSRLSWCFYWSSLEVRMHCTGPLLVVLTSCSDKQQPGQISTSLMYECEHYQSEPPNSCPLKHIRASDFGNSFDVAAHSAFYYHKHNSLTGTERRLCTTVNLAQNICFDWSDSKFTSGPNLDDDLILEEQLNQTPRCNE